MIHDAILTAVQTQLQADLVTGQPAGDNAIPTRIELGPILDDPDPSEARITITLHENDPDGVYKPGTTNMTDVWKDAVAEIECGGAITWYRRFTAKARVLLANTGEDLSTTRDIASTLRSRIEKSLLNMAFTGVTDPSTGEYVSKRILSPSLAGEMIQAGGPEAYDYHIKVRFQVETTVGVIQP